MRTIFKILLIALVVTSCTKNKYESFSTISGHLPELASKAIHFEANDSTYTAVADNTGKFKIEISLSNPHYVKVKEFDRNLFLIPNDSLIINKVDKKYIFSGGQSALINNYSTVWTTYMNAVADTTDFEKYYNQKPYDFLESVNKWITTGEEPLRKLLASHPNLNKEFVECEKARIKYQMYSDLNDYKCKDEAIPDDFYTYLETVNLNDSRLFLLDEYQYFLNSYIYLKVQRLKLENKFIETSKMFDIIEEDFNHNAIQSIIIKEVIKRQTLNLAVDDSLLERFKLMCSDSLYIQKIENTYQNLKPLLKGNNAPDFVFIDTNGKKFFLNNFKGKYLLIDVWSTTCSPCINEMPYLDKIKEENKDKNIEFVGACLSEETAWKKMLKKLNLEDRQFRVENGWNSKFRSDYLKSSGVPVYILIDPNGLIIDARAPKPSENLNEVINSLEI